MKEKVAFTIRFNSTFYDRVGERFGGPGSSALRPGYRIWGRGDRHPANICRLCRMRGAAGGETSLMFMVHPTLSVANMEDVVRAMDKVMRVAVR